MYKVEVIEYFTLKDFDKIKNIVRSDELNTDKVGKLFVGDTFECDEEMKNYIGGKNHLNKCFIKVLEEIVEDADISYLDDKKTKENKTKKGKKKKKD